MVTKFGIFCKKLRIERNEVAPDMAKKLNVTAPYISEIENGKRAIPEKWEEQLTRIYNLNEKQQHELKLAILSTKQSIELKVEDDFEWKKEFALKFVEAFNELSKEDIEKIEEIINQK